MANECCIFFNLFPLPYKFVIWNLSNLKMRTEFGSVRILFVWKSKITLIQMNNKSSWIQISKFYLHLKNKSNIYNDNLLSYTRRPLFIVKYLPQVNDQIFAHVILLPKMKVLSFKVSNFIWNSNGFKIWHIININDII